jgi:DNA polymerase-1
MKKLFLLDAYALIYRAHYALISRPLINSKGINTSAIYGFMNTLLDILQKEQPTHLAVAFDLDTPTFRHDFFPDYKGHREAQPEDITIAIPLIKQILSLFPIAQISAEGYEADDVVGTVALQAEKEGFEVYMMTPDKDYGQLLISDKLFLYKPAHFGNGIDVLGADDILKKWKIARVEQVVDMLALQGDVSDNIPGVKGIGEKTAQILLESYDSVEGIYENLDKVSKRQRELLEANRDNAFLSKRLAQIALDVPVKFDEKAFAIGQVQEKQLLPILDELEFKSLTEKIIKLARKQAKANDNTDANTNKSTNSAPENQQVDLFGNVVATAVVADFTGPHRIVRKNIENTPHDYHCIESQTQINALLSQLKAHTAWAFDTETTGLDTHTAELVGLSFCFKAGEAYYVPLPKDRAATQAILEQFRPLWESVEHTKIGQNIKYDMQMLLQYGIRLAPPLQDTMLMHYVLEPERRHNMDYLAETYLEYAPVSIDTLIGKRGKHQLTMRDVAIAKITEYAAEDADITYQLYLHFLPLLQALPEQWKLYTDIEMPLVPVLADMENNGVKIDVPFLSEYKHILAKDIKELEDRVFEKAEVRFNLNSPLQVGQVLFDKLKIPYRWQMTTKNKQYSTDEEKMNELAEEYPIIGDILEYRQVAKLQSTYVEALPALVNEKTGRIHSSFTQALTATGRLSSQNPNLQNIPIRSARGREIRKAFVAETAGHCILAADYSQIELRLVAALSGDEAMLDAFQKGLDIHTATAARIYGVPLEEVTKQQRYAAKTVNFSIIYGAGATNLSRQLDIKRAEAAQLIEQYFLQYTGLKSYMEKVVADARKDGFVSTLGGRRRYLRDLDSRNSLTRSHAERNAVNTPIQGTAADMIKIAMINIYAEMKRLGLKSKLILQVHDELVFDALTSELPQLRALILDAMRNAMPQLNVPIEVGIDVGENWLEAH